MKLLNTTYIECGQRGTWSRSVSWNCTGSYLAMASSDRVARIWTVDSGGGGSSSSGQQQQQQPPGIGVNSGGSSREILVISGGHTEAVTKVRFHPSEVNVLCTAALDGTIRLWDIRSANQRPIGKIDVKQGKEPMSIEWYNEYGRTKNNSNNKASSSAIINNNNKDPRRGISSGQQQGSSSSLLVVTEVGSTIYVYDVRKLGGGGGGSISSVGRSSGTNNNNNSNALYSFCTQPSHITETCLFAPPPPPHSSYDEDDGGGGGGQLSLQNQTKYLIAGSSMRGTGTSEVRAWPCLHGHDNSPISLHDHDDAAVVDHGTTGCVSDDDDMDVIDDDVDKNEYYCYPAHAGPIYEMCISNNGSRLATGSADSIVGIWDMNTMCCTHNITRRSKYIRGLSFSYDSQMIAICSEEDTIDISNANNGELISLIPIHNPQQQQQSRFMASSSSSSTRLGGGNGADDVAWHPKEYLLACARMMDMSNNTSALSGAGGGGGTGGVGPNTINANVNSPVTVMKLSFDTTSSSSSQYQ